MTTFAWRLTDEQIRSASSQFHQLDGGTGFLTGAQVRELLLNTGLTTNELAQIWNLSDFNQDGKLSEKEWIVAFFLIQARFAKQNLPDKLPDSLVSFLSDSSSSAGAGGGGASSLTGNHLSSQSGISSALVPMPSQGTSQPPMSALASQGSEKWAMSGQQYLKYKETFSQFKDANGKIGGNEAIALFTQSELSSEILASIWTMADLQQSGSLGEVEFAIAMHLIHYKKSGGELPTSLPSILLTTTKEAANATQNSSTSSASSSSLALYTTSIQQPAPLPLSIPQIVLPDISIAIPEPATPQFDMSPLIPYPPDDLADKFGVTPTLMNPYDPSTDIQRAQTEVLNSVTAQKVLEQSEPELKAITLKLKGLLATQKSLQDSLSQMTASIGVVESQRQSLHSIMNDTLNQMAHSESELQIQYQELVSLKAAFESLATTQATGDLNSLRQLRQQVTQEQYEVTHQLDQFRSDKILISTELDLAKKELERLNMEISQISASYSPDSLATMSMSSLAIGSTTSTSSAGDMSGGVPMGMDPTGRLLQQQMQMNQMNQFNQMGQLNQLQMNFNPQQGGINPGLIQTLPTYSAGGGGGATFAPAQTNSFPASDSESEDSVTDSKKKPKALRPRASSSDKKTNKVKVDIMATTAGTVSTKKDKKSSIQSTPQPMPSSKAKKEVVASSDKKKDKNQQQDKSTATKKKK